MSSFLIIWLKAHWRGVLVGLVFILWTAGAVSFGIEMEREHWLLLESERIAKETKTQLISSETARKKEGAHAEKVARIDQNEQPKLKEIDNEKDRLIAALRSDNQRLSVRIRTPAHSCTDTSGTGSGVDPGETRAELSETDSAFFISEAGRADKIVVQLNACQQLLLADREVE